MPWYDYVRNFGFWFWSKENEKEEEEEELEEYAVHGDFLRRILQIAPWKIVIVTLMILFLILLFLASVMFAIKQMTTERDLTKETTIPQEQNEMDYIETHNASEFIAFEVYPLLSRRNYTESLKECKMTKNGSSLFNVKSKTEEKYFVELMLTRTSWFLPPCETYFLDYRMKLDAVWISRTPFHMIPSYDMLSPDTWIFSENKEDTCLALDYLPPGKLMISNCPCTISSKYFICKNELCQTFNRSCFSIPHIPFEVSFEFARHYCKTELPNHAFFISYIQEELAVVKSILSSLFLYHVRFLLDGIFNRWYEAYDRSQVWIMKNRVLEGKLNDYCLVITQELLYQPVDCKSLHCALCIDHNTLYHM